MPNPTVADVRETISRATSVVVGATALIRGFAERLRLAVAEAIANGATAEELAPVQTEIDLFDTHATDLAAAVQEHTPGAPEPNPVTE